MGRPQVIYLSEPILIRLDCPKVQQTQILSTFYLQKTRIARVNLGPARHTSSMLVILFKRNVFRKLGFH